MMQKDKILHFIGGLIIAFFVGLIHPIAGLISALYAGWLKEQLDKRDPEHHTYDLKDMYATWMGGAIGVALLIIKDIL